MKVLSASRILYMCLLILVTSMAWCVVKPDVVNAYDVPTFYGAGNCKCADLSDCPSGCNDNKWINDCDDVIGETNNCVITSTNKPCGRTTDCKGYTGGSYNCVIYN